MKKQLLSLALLSVAWLAGGSAFALDQDADGYYLIGSKADLQAWTEISGYEATNAKLTADIDDVDFMLCTNSASFEGIFDGQGHTITLNIDTSIEHGGLFYNIKGTVKNLIVGGTFVARNKNCGIVAGYSWASTTKFENVVNIAEMEVDWTGNVSNGGFLGITKYDVNFVNCISAIKVTGNQGYNHGFVGWMSGGKAYINNCVSIVDVSGTAANSSESFGNHGTSGRFSISNSYAVKTSADQATPFSSWTYTTAEEIASGKIAYNINTAVGYDVLFQTLGSDAYPVPFNTHGTVYASGRKHCDLTDYEGVTYNNTSGETIIDPHVYSDFHCTYCGIFQTDYKTPDGDGFYELGTVDDVKWFTGMVNEEHQTTIKGKLTADIDFTSVTHTPIGPDITYKYNGIFDGQGHRIKNMIIDNGASEQGFFGVIRGGTIIRNLIIDSSCSVTGTSRIGGLVGSAQVNTGSPIIIENCINEASIEATGAAGGILGAAQGSDYPAIQISNCLNTGEITGSPATAFCSWNNRGGSSLTNCANLGTINGADNAGNKFSYYCQLIRYEPNTLTVTNCYDLSGFDGGEDGQQGDQGSLTTSAPLTSGELCYKLNDDQSNIVWTQAIGTDGYPMPFNTSEEVKYVGDAGYTTMYDAFNDWALNGDAQAYIGTINGSALHLDEIDDIPAGTAVVISGTYYNKVSTTATATTTGNVLQGSNGSKQGGDGIYALAIKNDKVGFYPVASTVTIPEGKAYLEYTGSTEVKGFTFEFEDDATAIEMVNGQSSMVNGPIYNLAGQRINKMQKGINIVNGKKKLK